MTLHFQDGPGLRRHPQGVTPVEQLRAQGRVDAGA
jgi:hypothetical protein